MFLQRVQRKCHDANDSLNSELPSRVMPAAEAKYKISHISRETNVHLASAL